MRNPLLLIAVLLIAGSIQAQNKQNPFAASLNAVALDYQGPVTGKLLNPQNMTAGVQVGTHIYLSPAVNFSLQTSLAPSLKMPFGDEARPTLFDASTLVRFKFNNGRMMRENAFFGPYVASGFGMASLSNSWQPYLPVAAGMRFRMSENVSLNLESMFRQGFGQNYSSLQHSFGVTFVVPEKDKEPEAAPEPSPKPPRNVVAQNQPEPQRERIQRPAYLPDSDGDGIADVNDNCPDEMGLIQFGGCPYTSATSGDHAPAEAMVEAVSYDAAPKPEAIARVASAKAEESREKARMAFNVTNVTFEINQEELNEEAKEVLDYVAQYLQDNPEAKLMLRGHADATGPERTNKLLSVKRAFNVKRYLAYEKGVSLKRIDSNGFGEQVPIADNESEEGRAQNRRVEMMLQ